MGSAFIAWTNHYNPGAISRFYCTCTVQVVVWWGVGLSVMVGVSYKCVVSADPSVGCID